MLLSDICPIIALFSPVVKPPGGMKSRGEFPESALTDKITESFVASATFLREVIAKGERMCYNAAKLS